MPIIKSAGVLHFGSELSVRDNRTIFYTMHSRVAERARDDLGKQIRHVHQEKYKPTNPIIETAGIIKLEQSTDPEQQAIGQLMRMMEGIREQVASIRQQLTAPTTGTSFISGSIPINALTAGIHPNFISSGGIITGLQVAGTPLVLRESVKSDKRDKDDS